MTWILLLKERIDQALTKGLEKAEQATTVHCHLGAPLPRESFFGHNLGFMSPQKAWARKCNVWTLPAISEKPFLVKSTDAMSPSSRSVDFCQGRLWSLP